MVVANNHRSTFPGALRATGLMVYYQNRSVFGIAEDSVHIDGACKDQAAWRIMDPNTIRYSSLSRSSVHNSPQSEIFYFLAPGKAAPRLQMFLVAFPAAPAIAPTSHIRSCAASTWRGNAPIGIVAGQPGWRRAAYDEQGAQICKSCCARFGRHLPALALTIRTCAPGVPRGAAAGPHMM